MKGGASPRENRYPSLRLRAALRDGILEGGPDAVQSEGLNRRGAPRRLVSWRISTSESRGERRG